MSEPITPKEWGYRVGYAEFEPNTRPLPPAPYPLRDPNRYQWIDGWFAGRRLAKRHHEEMEIEVMTITAPPQTPEPTLHTDPTAQYRPR